MAKNNRSILIVEDDVSYANMLKIWLTKSTTSSIDIVNRAEQGIAYLANKKPDIIFLDNRLPELNGNEVLKTYKLLSNNSYIILMSVDLDSDIAAESIYKGADYILDKNKTDKELVLKVIEGIH